MIKIIINEQGLSERALLAVLGHTAAALARGEKSFTISTSDGKTPIGSCVVIKE